MRREKKHLPKAEKITIKKNKKTTITKFKLRTPKYLFTLKVDDTTKAEKIMQSIPPNLKKEQFNLRFQKATGQIEKTHRVDQVRKDIARIKTVLRGKQAQA
mgnify:CR=1 FL=1